MPRPSAPIEQLPTCDEIAARAYELFVADGRRLSKVADHWLRAERELLDQALARMNDVTVV